MMVTAMVEVAVPMTDLQVGHTTFSKLEVQIARGKKSWFKIPIIYMYKCVGVSLVAK